MVQALSEDRQMPVAQNTKLFVVVVDEKAVAVLNGSNSYEESAFEEAGFPQANPEQRKQWEDSRPRHVGIKAEPHRWIARLDRGAS
jgi:hypothetical protein